MNRALTILYVFFSFEIGCFLFVFPWMGLWEKNFFAGHYPWVLALARNYFVRGAVSGVGLADIWLAVYEAVRLRRRRQKTEAIVEAGHGPGTGPGE